jgi:drug/metabolite transporter (DMT)-like permease
VRDDDQRFLDQPGNVATLLRAFTVLGIIALLLDFIVHRRPVDPWERLWGFYGIFGFIGVTLLILGARLLRRVVMRDEDYYDAD